MPQKFCRMLGRAQRIPLQHDSSSFYHLMFDDEHLPSE